MSAFSDVLINILIPAIETAAESKLVDVLQKLHDSNPEQYEAAIRAGHVFIKPVLSYVAQTDTKIDDGIANALDEAITISAARNGIIFTS